MTAEYASKDSPRVAASAWVAAAIAVALGMRLAALWLAWGIEPTGDPLNYLRLAQNLLAGDGLALPRSAIGPEPVPTALFPPLLPLLLAAAGLIVPLNAATLTILNTLVDGAAALLLARLAQQLGAPRIALPAALAYLLWPSIALMAPLAYKEGLVIALLLATVVALLEQARRPGFGWAIASGGAAGALLLTQPALASLLPILFVALAGQFPSRRRWLLGSMVAAATALVVMLPWWVRNAMQFGAFIPLTTSGGLALWEGAHPAGGVVWQLPPSEWNRLGELDAARAAAAEAWRVIAADPLAYLGRCLVKFPSSFFYSNWAVDQLAHAKGQRWPGFGESAALRFGATVIELWAVVMAAIGLVRSRSNAVAWLLWACIAQVMLFGIWFEFSERHRLFMTPFILLMAAMMLAERNSAEPQSRSRGRRADWSEDHR